MKLCIKYQINHPDAIRIFWNNKVNYNTIAPDALASFVARSLTAILLSMGNKWVLLLHGKPFSCIEPMHRNKPNITYLH